MDEITTATEPSEQTTAANKDPENCQHMSLGLGSFS